MDLRSEGADAAKVAHVEREWRSAPLSPREVAICGYAEKLTRSPLRNDACDLAALRRAGLDDDAITDLTQVVAFFNYINRIAEGLGVDPEEFFPSGA